MNHGASHAGGSMKCETPKSPPGDYNTEQSARGATGVLSCETPKSPPGDYNPVRGDGRSAALGVKHLNPRQGITTHAVGRRHHPLGNVKCETPKSPPGDYNPRESYPLPGINPAPSVKHLNPRQGITTRIRRRR